jgi:hypothetical protein
MVRVRDGLEPAFSVMPGREHAPAPESIHPDIADASYERRMVLGWHPI